jgi:hypothetical protein
MMITIMLRAAAGRCSTFLLAALLTTPAVMQNHVHAWTYLGTLCMQASHITDERAAPQ